MRLLPTLLLLAGCGSTAAAPSSSQVYRLEYMWRGDGDCGPLPDQLATIDGHRVALTGTVTVELRDEAGKALCSSSYELIVMPEREQQ